MSSVTDPYTDFVIKQAVSDFYWNGRGWTSSRKRALRFVSRESAIETQVRVDATLSTVLEMWPRLGTHKREV